MPNYEGIKNRRWNARKYQTVAMMLFGATALQIVGCGTQDQASETANVGVTRSALTASPFLEENGMVVIEAENYHATTSRGGHAFDWTADESASGGALMVANPNDGTTVDVEYCDKSPRLDFKVTFQTTGIYYVWIRGKGKTAKDNSGHLGIDGRASKTSDRIAGFSRRLRWSRSTLDVRFARVRVDTAGEHTINFYMREDGFQIDKILLTTNARYFPTGTGPAESDASDIDECASGTDNCSDNAKCANTPGGYECICNDGYSGDGFLCIDIDECASGADNCDDNATCTNTPGGYECICNDGYTGDGISCRDIDECVLLPNICGENAMCRNTSGSYVCLCKQGYEDDGESCKDIDECAIGMDYCNENATCTNTPGNYLCSCNAGYDGDGVSCNDIDECLNNTDNCDALADCINTPGGFICQCPSDMVGDGTNCRCNLTGTFATLAEMDVEWDPVIERIFGMQFTIIDGGSDTLYSWSISTFNYDGSVLTADARPCGGTTPDLCSSMFQETYGQYFPDEIWDRSTMPVTHQTMQLYDADPGEPFVTPLSAILLGVSVPSPAGEWPPAWNSPGVTFPDHDDDTAIGITSYVKTSGVSPSCGYPYRGLINPTGSADDEMDIVRVYLGSRTLGWYDGVLDSCDRITGSVAGPNNGMPQVNDRIGGCYVDTDRECTQEEFEYLDETSGVNVRRILATRFTMIRVPDDISCGEVRALSF